MKEYDLQPENGVPRRGFKDDELDIVIWQLPDQSFSYQMTFYAQVPSIGGNFLEQRLLTFSPDKGINHLAVPLEMASPAPSKLAKPATGKVPKDWLVNHLSAHHNHIPDSIFQFILSTLK